MTRPRWNLLHHRAPRGITPAEHRALAECKAIALELLAIGAIALALNVAFYLAITYIDWAAIDILRGHGHG